MRRKLVAGNWKMHGSHAANALLLDGLKAAQPYMLDVVVCAPFPYLAETAVTLSGQSIAWGAQDCSAHEQGAYTGEVSAAHAGRLGLPLRDRGPFRAARLSRRERSARGRQGQGRHRPPPDADRLCRRDPGRAWRAGQTEAVVKRQLSAVIHTLAHCVPQIVVAYEPVWAIGTGRTASPEQAQAVHALLRAQLHAATPKAAEMRLLYGGSVKPDNAKTLFGQPDIDGGLIGGASLKAADFVAICRAAD